MIEVRIAARYAKSMIDLAEQRGELDIVYADMQFIANTIQQSKPLQQLLKSPVIDHHKKLKVLQTIFSSKICEITAATFEILAKKNREILLPYLADEFIRQYQAKKSIVKAVIITPSVLSEELKNEFVTLLEKEVKATQIILEEKIDENLIGGFILKVGDKQIDTSIQSALHKIKLNIQDNSYIVKY